MKFEDVGHSQEETSEIPRNVKVDGQQEDAKTKRLVAAAAAYVAVHFRGQVLVSLKKDAVTLGSKRAGGILQG